MYKIFKKDLHTAIILYDAQNRNLSGSQNPLTIMSYNPIYWITLINAKALCFFELDVEFILFKFILTVHITYPVALVFMKSVFPVFLLSFTTEKGLNIVFLKNS